MKTLHFIYCGTEYAVSLEKETLGHVLQYGSHIFQLPHPEWVILGVSKHHWSRTVDVPIVTDINPKSLIKGIVWDRDHGTIRKWGGVYFGKIPRISTAWVE